MLVGFCGFAGAGKTTSIELLERRGHGLRVYVGEIVTAEVQRRKLPLTPASERLVRDELRQAEGMGALARRALPTIRSALSANRTVWVDAIYCAEERDIYCEAFSDRLATVGIETSLENRANRLSARNSRPLSLEDLEKRDRYEIERLGTADVMTAADYTLCNDGTLDELKLALDGLIGYLANRSGS